MRVKSHQKITSHEREILANYLASGISKSECARLLNRPRRTILREIANNGSWLKDTEGHKVFVYIAITAQAKSEKRQSNSAHNKHPLKNKDVYKYVLKKLRKGWSPESIILN